MPTARDRALSQFESRYGGGPDLLARAPGRVNLIGEHTDYSDGFALPMALPFDTVIAATPVETSTVEVSSEGFGSCTFSLAADPAETPTWARYIHGMAHVLDRGGHLIGAWNGIIASDIPSGASLSSSAALEIAAGLTFLGAAEASIDTTELARLGQAVENDVMGLPSGVMDQLISATAQAGSAMLLDCRDLSLRAVPLPAGVTVVVLDTGTRRQLVDSAYAERQDTCRRVADALGVRSMRDLSPDALERLADDRVGRRRARHVVSENQRVLEAAQALADGDVQRMGQLMTESHTSLRDDYEVSGPALDSMVDLALTAPGCLGARMTGGGFAGGAVALVETPELDGFLDWVGQRYAAPDTQPASAPSRLYPVVPAAGASIEYA